jgi:uncharacterized protein
VDLDTSLLVGLFVEGDAHASRARSFSADDAEVLVVSDFAAAEFSSVIARLTRTHVIEQAAAREVFGDFDEWRARFTASEEITPGDVQIAISMIRQLDLNILAPDAINLAIARRLGASIATFDRGMARNAAVPGIAAAAL